NLNGGQLAASNVIATGGEITQSGGQLVISNQFQLMNATFTQTGGSIAQSGLCTLADASWSVASGVQQAGPVQLNVSSSSSSHIAMPAGPCTMHFGGSSGQAWSAAAILYIDNWSGSLYGGGNHRVLFGATAADLTAQQLNQIYFSNPAGLPSGLYHPRILAT